MHIYFLGLFPIRWAPSNLHAIQVPDTWEKDIIDIIMEAKECKINIAFVSVLFISILREQI